MAMKIIRANGVAAISYMENYILPDDDYASKEVVIEKWKELMVVQPDNVCLIQAWEEVGDKIVLRAFLMAYNNPDIRHVFILQAWSDPRMQGRKVQDNMFLRLQQWTESLGKFSIRAETLRNPQSFLRRWGFKNITSIIEFTLPDDLASKILEVNASSEQDEPVVEIDVVASEDTESLNKYNEAESLLEESSDGQAEQNSVDTSPELRPAAVERPADGLVEESSEPDELAAELRRSRGDTQGET